MMDYQKEREAFEELIDIEIIISEGFKFNPNINQYYHPDHTNHRLSYAYLMGAWMVWQEKAQAVPEGFVLVSKTPSLKVLDRLYAEHDIDEERATYIYRDIIDAQEQSHE